MLGVSCAHRDLTSAFDTRFPSGTDLEGKKVKLLAHPGLQGVVCIFITEDCPIANRAIPEVRRLREQFSPQGFAFWFVYVDRKLSTESIRKHAMDYEIYDGLILDFDRKLVQKSRAVVTPEAAVFSADGVLVYHGRIDDRFGAVGVHRPQATTHDLEEVLSALASGRRPPFTHRPAVGCYISDLP